LHRWAERLAAKRPRLSSGPPEPLVRLGGLVLSADSTGGLPLVEATPVAEYSDPVSIELPGTVEEQLRNLAAKQGRDVRTLVEEAIRQYLDLAAITDLDAAQVAEAQVALLDELPAVSDWKADDA